MPTHELSGTTALVSGASRGFGRAVAIALSKHGAHVAVARDHGRLEELRAQLGDTFTPVTADAADPAVASQLLDKHRPRTLVLNAAAGPTSQGLWQSYETPEVATHPRDPDVLGRPKPFPRHEFPVSATVPQLTAAQPGG
jgi:NAD(P)-dependent dehydrogenase (short-subunit alcohol dehydrogenase family)